MGSPNYMSRKLSGGMCRHVEKKIMTTFTIVLAFGPGELCYVLRRIEVGEKRFVFS
jgi:hypothetical protein